MALFDRRSPTAPPDPSTTNGDGSTTAAGDDAARALAELERGDVDRGTVTRLSTVLARSAKQAGARAVLSGQWAASELVDLAPHLPIRDLPTLQLHYGGLTGPALADQIVRQASRAAAAVGAVGGTLIGAEELLPPAWVAVPVEIAVETLLVAAIEVKMVAELHEAYGRPVPGAGRERMAPLLQAWAERRGVDPKALLSVAAVREVVGLGGRRELIRMVRRRMTRVLGRNASTLAPVMIGAVAGAELNRRAARKLAEAVQRDLTDPARRP